MQNETIHAMVVKDVAALAGMTSPAGDKIFNHIGDLSDGALCVYTDTGISDSTGTNAATIKTGTSGFYIALGRGASESGARISPKISYDELVAEMHVYIPSQGQSVQVGADGQGTSAKTSGAFTAANVGLIYTCTSASSSGDFRAVAAPLLRHLYGDSNLKRGQLVPASHELVLNAVYQVYAAGTPDAWGTGALTPLGADGTSLATTYGSPAKGEVCTIRIVETTEAIDAYNYKRTYQYTVKTGDSVATIVTALVNQINSDVDARWTASVLNSGTGILITHNSPGGSIKVSMQDEFEAASIIASGSRKSLHGIAGTGTFAQVTDLLRQTETLRGKTSLLELKEELFKSSDNNVAGQNYDTVIVKWANNKPDAMTGAKTMNNVLVVLFPAEAANASPANLVTIINNLA